MHRIRGCSSITSDPVIVDRPDLRQYNRPPSQAPTDATPPERREWIAQRRRDRHRVHTRWRTTHGAVDQYGDLVAVYTGECQGCARWFMVERTPPTGSGRWPTFCSDECRADARALSKRKSARRRRAGLTDGRRRPRVDRFDPEDHTDPVGAAESIVDRRETSTPTAYQQAFGYLDEAMTDAHRPEHAMDLIATANPRDWHR